MVNHAQSQLVSDASRCGSVFERDTAEVSVAEVWSVSVELMAVFPAREEGINFLRRPSECMVGIQTGKLMNNRKCGQRFYLLFLQNIKIIRISYILH